MTKKGRDAAGESGETLARAIDIDRVIRDLREERKRIDRIIESLESIAKTGTGYIKPPSRRGRKFMNAADRQEVAERMKRYWARRREEKEKNRKAADESAPEGGRKPGGPENGPAEMARLDGTGFAGPVFGFAASA